MNRIEQRQSGHEFMLWLGVLLAVIAAIAYLLIQMDVLAIGDVRPSEGPPTIIYVAAASYFVGGLLILARSRWLWIAGAVVNALVIVFYINLYQSRPEVLLSPGGLATKATQVLLELILLYLIIADWRERSR